MGIESCQYNNLNVHYIRILAYQFNILFSYGSFSINFSVLKLTHLLWARRSQGGRVVDSLEIYAIRGCFDYFFSQLEKNISNIFFKLYIPMYNSEPQMIIIITGLKK